MVYHLAGGNTDYDPTLKSEVSIVFEAMDGDHKKITIVDATPDGGGLIMPGFLEIGRPIIVDENMPTKMRRHGPGIKRAKLLDTNSFTDSLSLVNQTFKDIVEEFEPGVHQFFPLEYYDAQGKEKIGEGYWMIICQRLDTLHDTLCFPPRNERGFIPRKDSNGRLVDPTDQRVVFSKEKIGNHHMWRDKFYARANLFSNALAERLKAANLSGLVFDEIEEA